MRMGIGFVALGDLDIVGEPASSESTPRAAVLHRYCAAMWHGGTGELRSLHGARADTIAQQERSQQAMDRQASRFS